MGEISDALSHDMLRDFQLSSAAHYLGGVSDLDLIDGGR